jgi:hypothetical protein
MDEEIRQPDKIYKECLLGNYQETEEDINNQAILKRREERNRKKLLKEELELERAIQESIRYEELKIQIKENKKILLPIINRIKRISSIYRNDAENCVLELLEEYYNNSCENIKIKDTQFVLLNKFLFDNYLKFKTNSTIKTCINDETYNYIINHIINI